MKILVKGIMVMMAIATLAGCQQPNSNNSALDNGRPVAPSGQAVPGGPVGSGPAGQPQS